MGIVVQKQAILPAGEHTGIISKAVLGTRTYDKAKGPEPSVEINITPDWKAPDGVPVMPVSLSYNPVLNGQSALYKMLQAIGREPADGANWEAGSLVGARIVFSVEHNSKGFVNVLKSTVRKAPK